MYDASSVTSAGRAAKRIGVAALAVKAVSYTHLDVYKRQDGGGAAAEFADGVGPLPAADRYERA